MTRISILGGTGMVGAALAREAIKRGDFVTVTSRTVTSRDSPARIPGAQHVVADVRTGQGVAQAIADTDEVIFAVNATRHPRDTMCAGLARTLEELDAVTTDGRERPLVVLPSIVGCDSVPVGYYRAKVEQEQILAAWHGPSLTIRVTQFHQFVNALLSQASRMRMSPRAPLPLQPVEASAAAAAMLDHIDHGPSAAYPHIAGPTALTLSDAARVHAHYYGRRGLPMRIPLMGLGDAKRGALTPDSDAATLTGPSFADWLTNGGDGDGAPG